MAANTNPPQSQHHHSGHGEEMGEEGGQGGGGRSGGHGRKKNHGGGRATKLPVCSLPTNMTPAFFIGGSNGVALVEGPLLSLGWKRITDKTDERFKLKWAECKSKINYTTFREGEQIVNHIPNAKLLTNKLGLLNSLQAYERVTLSTKGRLPRLRLTDFFPETYRLDERVDRATFLDVYQDGEIWICKPVGMNQGKGIFLLRSREEIDKLLAERDAQKDVGKLSTWRPMIRLVQRYIMNPLLLEGRKFDIRAYMLIASTLPYLVLFHHGYVRLSCMKYDGDDTNLVTHLTNQFVQKKDPSYNEVKENTAWSIDKFNSYINTHYAADKELEEDWVFSTLTVWLIEINVNPSLTINCEALKEVIPGVVEETLHVSIEAFEKTRKNQPLMPIQSLKGFEILHCGSSPFNTVAPRQTRSVSPAKRDTAEKLHQVQTTLIRSRRYSSPRSLPRMSLNLPNTQVSPYLRSSQGGNPGGLVASNTRSSQQPSLPSIAHSNGLANGKTVVPAEPPANTTTTTTQPSPVTVTFSDSRITTTTNATTTTKTTTNTNVANNANSTTGTWSTPAVIEEGGNEEDIFFGTARNLSASSGRRKRNKPDRGN